MMVTLFAQNWFDYTNTIAEAFQKPFDISQFIHVAVISRHVTTHVECC